MLQNPRIPTLQALTPPTLHPETRNSLISKQNDEILALQQVTEGRPYPYMIHHLMERTQACQGFHSMRFLVCVVVFALFFFKGGEHGGGFCTVISDVRVTEISCCCIVSRGLLYCFTRIRRVLHLVC